MLCTHTTVGDARYRVEELLGCGAFGEVWRARDLGARCDVAVKVLNLVDQPDALMATLFQQEVRTGASMRHEHIAALLDAGWDEGCGRPFLVMELLEGVPVDKVDANLAGVLTIFDQLLAALAHAHARGVVHRDLKPDNIMVIERAGGFCAKLLDFGISKIAEAWTERPTPHDGEHTEPRFLGTLAYMSPEQASGAAHSVGPGSDLYSAGVVLYELLAGRLPFEGSGIQLLHQHLFVEPRSLEVSPRYAREAAPVIGELRRLVTWLLAKPYAGRPPHAAAVRSRLQGIQAQLPDAPRAQVPAPGRRSEDTQAVSGFDATTDASVIGAHVSTSRPDLVALRKTEPMAVPNVVRFRPLPPTGRAELASLLLSHAQQTIASGDARLLTLFGEPSMDHGVTVRRVVEALAEQGAMMIVRVGLAERESLAAALEATLYAILRTPTLEPQPLQQRLVEVYGEPPAIDVERLGRALLTRASADDAAFGRVAAHAIAHLARLPEPRPLFVWFEADMRVASSLGDWCDELAVATRAAQVPLLCVVTASDEAALQRLRSTVEVLASVDTLVAGPLPAVTCAEVACALLPGLPAPAAEAVASVCDGSPLLVRELLADWLQRGLIRWVVPVLK